MVRLRIHRRMLWKACIFAARWDLERQCNEMNYSSAVSFEKIQGTIGGTYFLNIRASFFP